jgi:hypothetical protein
MRVRNSASFEVSLVHLETPRPADKNRMVRTRLRTGPDGWRESIQLTVVLLLRSFRSWFPMERDEQPLRRTKAHLQ